MATDWAGKYKQRLESESGEEGARAESGASSLEELSHPKMDIRPEIVYNPVAPQFGALVLAMFLPILAQAVSQALSGVGRLGGQSYPGQYPVQLSGVMTG